MAKPIEIELAAVYEEMMWLARRPDTSAAAARSWYTHVAAVRLSRKIRRFTGKVSVKALAPEAVLRLEHFKRIQTTLTQMVERHRQAGKDDAAEFIDCVLDFEQVHIVTESENHAAMKAKGDYAKAGIELVDWSSLQVDRRQVLWRKMLKGRVSNAGDFAPSPN